MIDGTTPRRGTRWDRWHNASFEVRNPHGEPVRVSYQVHEVAGDVVRVAGFLHDAGFMIEQQYGDWDRGPVTGASEEIITIARRA